MFPIIIVHNFNYNHEKFKILLLSASLTSNTGNTSKLTHRSSLNSEASMHFFSIILHSVLAQQNAGIKLMVVHFNFTLRYLYACR